MSSKPPTRSAKPMAQLLSEAERKEMLPGLDGWRMVEGRDAIANLRVSRFRRGLRLHDAGRARGRADEPSPRVAQRLPHRRGDARDPRRRRTDAARRRARADDERVGARIKHDPEKRLPVFGKDHAQTR